MRRFSSDEELVQRKTVLAMEEPVDPCSGIFLYYETASDWSNGSGVVVNGFAEVLPS